MTTISVHAEPRLKIRPPKGWAPVNLRELWEARDLLMTLAGRDVKLRYRQTFLGIAWVVLQPLLTAGVFTLVFGIIANLPSNGLSYFPFSFAGLLGWGIFSNILSKSSSCLVGNSQLIAKVYFPRMMLPLSTVVSSLLDLAVTLGMMAVLMVVYCVSPTWGLLLLPVWIVLIAILALGVGLYTSSLTVSYRDVQYLVPVILQFLMLASPVGYAVPEKLAWAKTLFLLNPISGLIEAFRWSVLGTPVHWWAVVYSAVFALIALLGGAIVFKRMERRFADVI